MNQLLILKRKTISGFLRALLLVSLILWPLQPLGGVADDAGTYKLKVTCSGMQCGSITVTKDAIPNDGTRYSAQKFAFSSDALGPFTLVDDSKGQSNSITFSNLQPGDYEIAEQPQSGWLQSFIDSGDARSDDVLNGKIVHLGVGESATVKFVNAQSTSSDPYIEPLKVKKTTLNTSVYRGEDICYTITVCNPNGFELTNVNLVDVLPKGVELVSTSPDPTTGLSWHVGTLDAGECFEVALTVECFEKPLYGKAYILLIL
jgi:uncharacterized repeat protein (TIGR01451 family)